MENKYPKTILYPDTFIKKPSADFDGIFDWSWLNGCFGDTNIKPTDIDCIIERKGNFLIMETKDIGVKIKRGQQILLRELHNQGNFTIMVIYGKKHPIEATAFYPNKNIPIYLEGVIECQNFVKWWFQTSDKNSKRKNSLHLEACTCDLCYYE